MWQTNADLQKELAAYGQCVILCRQKLGHVRLGKLFGSVQVFL
jgi:hypothetical protein